MYFHGATVRSVELTSGIKDAWGLLKRPTSATAVTRRCPRESFFTRNDGFKYFTVMPTSSGRRKTFYCSVTGILGYTAFSLGWFDWAHVDNCFNRASCTIVANNLGVKHIIRSTKHLVELVLHCLGQQAVWVDTDTIGEQTGLLGGSALVIEMRTNGEDLFLGSQVGCGCGTGLAAVLIVQYSMRLVRVVDDSNFVSNCLDQVWLGP